MKKLIASFIVATFITGCASTPAERRETERKEILGVIKCDEIKQEARNNALSAAWSGKTRRWVERNGEKVEITSDEAYYCKREPANTVTLW